MSARRPPEPPPGDPTDDEGLEGSRQTGTDRVALPGPPPDFDDADPELAAQLKGRSAAEIYGDEDGASSDEPPEDPEPDASPAFRPPPRNNLGSTRIAKRLTDDDELDEDHPDATQAGPPVKLEIVSGPDEGNVKRFKGVRMVIGRIKGCDLVLSDPSVSRKHVELIVSENGVLLRDLGSGNGTKVNGERATEQRLEHEDVIALGQTKIRFFDEGTALKRAEEERERKAAAERLKKAAEEEARAAEDAKAEAAALAASPVDPEHEASDASGGELGVTAPQTSAPARFPLANPRVLAGAAALLALFVLVISAVFFTRHAKPLPPDAKHLLAAQKMEAAEEAAAENRFKDALSLISQAKKLVPDIDKKGAGTRILLDARAQNSLALAEGEIEQKRYDDARAELTRTPSASERMNALHGRLQTRLDGEQGRALAQTASDLISRRDFPAAEQALEALAPELQKDFKARLEAEKAKASKEKQESAAHDSEERDRMHQREQQKRKAYVEDAFLPVAKRLNELDWARAQSECDRVAEHYENDTEIRERARDIKRRLPVLKTNFEDGRLKMDGHAYESAVRPLRKARDAYREVNLPSTLGRQLDDLVLAALVESGKAALREYDYHAAAGDFREAQRISPQDARARAGLENLASEADQQLQEAFLDRDRDPRKSREKFKLVLELAAPGSATYQTARKQLKQLEP